MKLLRRQRPNTGAVTLLAAVVPTVLAASLIGFAPAHAATTAGASTAHRDQIACPRGFVCIYPEINFNGQPYVKRTVDGSVRHLPDYIRGNGSSVINNSSRTARVYQKDNYFGRHVCVGREGGTISDLRSYQLNDTTHSLRNNDTPCGA
ncbi:peptidase inhibitor family I36 protein [Streptomyces albidocamelliae]|uniref:Peptidase inhibitor family I36 protein n=1 Tax=Streptomyces albidocamelliae TaxID=2981135 RepID=A0ABY6F1F5_9ACTN|nr:peptidase inhibitor family I36 protein [Streptomyces sp. HUAS 14-6]UXY40502.1 peptidase inhibitor family I36 protein [Streptomyces sp. HUAS 14-6]